MATYWPIAGVGFRNSKSTVFAPQTAHTKRCAIGRIFSYDGTPFAKTNPFSRSAREAALLCPQVLQTTIRTRPDAIYKPTVWLSSSFLVAASLFQELFLASTFKGANPFNSFLPKPGWNTKNLATNSQTEWLQIINSVQ